MVLEVILKSLTILISGPGLEGSRGAVPPPQIFVGALQKYPADNYTKYLLLNTC